jgi:PAS domain S-box-containing protein
MSLEGPTDSYSWLIDAAPCALLAVDERMHICFVNPRAEQLFEYESGELLGKPLELLLPWALRAKHELLREPGLPAVSHELSGIKKNGATLSLDVTLSNTQGPYGSVAIAALTDVTERKRREDELTRSNRDLEQFAYIASHDLREPLRMVSSFLGLLSQRYKSQLDQDAQRYIHFAVDGATRMQRLIDGLLVYARVGSQKPAFTPVDTGAALRAAWLNLTQAVQQTDAQLESESLPVVSADGRLLQQLFQNLLDNAIKFRAEGKAPHISVSAREENGKAIISIKDDGIGFDIKNKERIFEMFRRLNEVGKYDGAGMGLAIAKRIVDLHHGEIDVDATSDAGCTFRITLPLANAP